MKSRDPRIPLLKILREKEEKSCTISIHRDGKLEKRYTAPRQPNDPKRFDVYVETIGGPQSRARAEDEPSPA